MLSESERERERGEREKAGLSSSWGIISEKTLQESKGGESLVGSSYSSEMICKKQCKREQNYPKKPQNSSISKCCELSQILSMRQNILGCCHLSMTTGPAYKYPNLLFPNNI